VCLATLGAAAETVKGPIEVLVVGWTAFGTKPGWPRCPDHHPHSTQYIQADESYRYSSHTPLGEHFPFWKTHLLNIGIRLATGDVLTFLDADAVVGPRFLDGARFLAASSLTALFYRVRRCSRTGADFSEYDAVKKDGHDLHPIAYEAYGSPERSGKGTVPRHPVFGNSQFSITREKLGDLRWDEDYFGRGFEDLDMIRRLWYRDQKGYCAAIMTDAEHAMFHIAHPYSPGYGRDRWNERNRRRYYQEPMHWVVGDNERKARELSEDGKCPPYKVVSEDDPTWRDEVIDGLDTILTLEEAHDQWLASPLTSRTGDTKPSLP
jgi:hypothetical protein